MLTNKFDFKVPTSIYPETLFHAELTDGLIKNVELVRVTMFHPVEKRDVEVFYNKDDVEEFIENGNWIVVGDEEC